MKVSIISPNKTLFSGEAALVSLPGVSGNFTVLDHHAPIVSVLEKGEIGIAMEENGDKSTFEIKSGFIEVHDNNVTVCVEI